ncbi:glycosyl transferase, group 2 family protein [hydrocarbon metagenome]|uniref:Glycosyl transferase, group 2 family protein n=1 Tax=hydrocarbon metagenome TaxID=938273 RepID=A0A0W8G452_9ZZZZ
MDVFAPDSAVPEPLLRALLVGGDASPELVRAAGLAETLAQTIPQTLADGPGAKRGGMSPADLELLARDLRLSAWEADPLRGSLAAPVLTRDAARPFLDAVRRNVLQTVAERDRPPDDSRYFARLLERREHDKTMSFLFGRLEAEPGNLHWLRHLAALALAAGDSEAAARAAAHLRHSPQGVLAPLAFVADRIDAEAAFLHHDFVLAERRFASAWAVFPMGPVRRIWAEALLRLGRRDEAIALLGRDFAAHPCNVTTLLRLHDLALGLDRARATLSGGLALLLYTCNKAADLDHTLASLAAADLSFAPGARLVVLDNGSTDATADVVTAWIDRMGGDRLSRVDLPVNIGAPAARNWLARHPAVMDAAYAAYLDDDADVPRDFLGRLAAAVQAFPKAGVYGCRVVDAANPAHIQSADLFFEPLPEPPGDPAFSRAFEPSRAHLHSLDMGRFDYLRPCASVTGCCHLFSRDCLRQVGDFDIRLSPSQYDDLDHDFRCLLAGHVPVYQGHLRVLHRKRTGSQGRPGGSQYAAGFANQFKLHQFHSREQFAAMAEAAFRAARLDAAVKWSWLSERMPAGTAVPGEEEGRM